MKFFDPALNLSVSQKILRLLIFAFFLVLILALLPAMVIGFVPAKAVKLPVMLISSLITLFFICLFVSNYKKYHKIMTHNTYTGKSKSEVIWMAFAYGLILNLIFYTSVTMTFSAIFTNYFGKSYNAVDIVTKIE